MHERRILLLLAIGVVLVAAGWFALRARRVRDRGAANSTGQPGTVPALQADPEEGLELRAELTRVAGGRRIRLLVEGGEAVLVLSDAGRPSEIGIAFGKAVLEPAPDRTHGAKLVAAVARWLDVELPEESAAPSELRAFPCSYARLGSDDEWEANKLFLELGRKNVEVFVNVSHDGRRVRLVEKDEDYREDLVALLAMILRDGIPPRRTPENDKNLASSEPLARAAAPVAEAKDVRQVAWLVSELLGTRKIEGKRTALLHWRHPREAPRQLATLEGWVTEITASPRSDVCVLSVVHPRSATSYSSDDPTSVVLFDVRAASLTTLVKSDRSLSYVKFSPDGSAVAFSIRDAATRKVSTRVFEVAHKRQIAASDVALDAAPYAWDEAGLILRAWDFGADAEVNHKHYRWQPGKGAPTAFPASPLSVSPDGEFSFSVGKGATEIVGGGKHAIEFSRWDDREALESLRDEEPRFVGSSGLVIDLGEPMLLDFATRRLRYLFREDAFRFESASRDGHLVLAWDPDDRLVWAELP